MLGHKLIALLVVNPVPQNPQVLHDSTIQLPTKIWIAAKAMCLIIIKACSCHNFQMIFLT